MVLLRSVLLLLAVLAVVKCQLALPQPIKTPTRVASLQEGLTVTSGVSIQHLPGTDNIVVVWLEVSDSIIGGTAQGAIFSTNGEVKATFPVSDPNTVLALRAPAQIVPQINGTFSVIYSTYSTTIAFYIRSFDASGQALTDPIPILDYSCIYMNAVYHESSGDIFMVSVPLNGGQLNYLLVHRLNTTGDILDRALFATSDLATTSNVNPTIAVNGNSVAISTAMVDSQAFTAILQVLVLAIDDLNNATTFLPYGTDSSTLSHQVVADPLNENSFVVFSGTAVNTANSSIANLIIGTRFTRENNSIARTDVEYTDVSITLSLALYGSGGIFAFTPGLAKPNFVVYPIQITNDAVFNLDLTQFDLAHAISANESDYDAFKDTRTATTIWSTGAAVVWTEVSATTGAFSVVAKVYGTFCGDNFAEGDEDCDGGVNCYANCTCPVGLVADNNNGCGLPVPVSPPVTAPGTTRPISVGPVATPTATTSDAYATTAITLAASIVVAAAALF